MEKQGKWGNREIEAVGKQRKQGMAIIESMGNSENREKQRKQRNGENRENRENRGNSKIEKIKKR